jgi:hypothetical protein
MKEKCDKTLLGVGIEGSRERAANWQSESLNFAQIQAVTLSLSDPNEMTSLDCTERI